MHAYVFIYSKAPETFDKMDKPACRIVTDKCYKCNGASVIIYMGHRTDDNKCRVTKQ